MGLLTVHCYTFAFPCIPTILMYYSVDDPVNLWKAAAVAVVSFAASFMITALVYRETEKDSAD